MDLNGRRLPTPKGRNRQLIFLVTGMLTLGGLALYPTVIAPIFNPEPWKQFREAHPPPTPKQN